jgi:hypothetical protein
MSNDDRPRNADLAMDVQQSTIDQLRADLGTARAQAHEWKMCADRLAVAGDAMADDLGPDDPNAGEWHTARKALLPGSTDPRSPVRVVLIRDDCSIVHVKNVIYYSAQPNRPGDSDDTPDNGGASPDSIPGVRRAPSESDRTTVPAGDTAAPGEGRHPALEAVTYLPDRTWTRLRDGFDDTGIELYHAGSCPCSRERVWVRHRRAAQPVTRDERTDG